MSKKYFLCNPIFIGVITIILLITSIILDIIVVDDPSRPYYLDTFGFSFYLWTYLGMVVAYIWFFLEKLSKQYPNHREAILSVRRMHIIPIKKNRRKLEEMQVNIKNTVAYFSDGSLQFQQIDSEWRAGLKWIAFSIICLFLIYPIELLIKDWMDAIRPPLLNYLNSIGL